MLILTGLFFNKKGNQSFYNSVKGYSQSYKITILTAATLNSDVYHDLNKIKQELPHIRVISVFPYKAFSYISASLDFLKKMNFGVSKKSENKVFAVNKSDKDAMLVNMPPTIKSKLSFYLRSYLLAISSFLHRLFNHVDVVCCYEINGSIASSCLKKFFNIPVFIKLQGTALGGKLNLIGTEEFNSVFSIDIAEIKRSTSFDLAIMTNDGTRGDVVLNHFGFASEKILFLNNGIDSRFEKAIHSSTPIFENGKLKSVKLCSVSRLTSWKRVDLILEIVHKLRGIIDISYTLIGIGSEKESQSILEIIKELKLENNVTFLKGASTEEVISVMSNSDLLISLNNFTNVSNPVFEALYIGIPVVTIHQSEFSEVLGPGMKSCVFVEEAKRSDLVSAVVNKISSIDMENYNELISFSKEFREFFPTWELRSKKELARIARIIK